MASPRTSHALACAIALAVGLAGSSAQAQPNPFDDFEKGTYAPAPKPAVPSDQPTVSPDPAYTLQQHDWTLGAGLQFAYTGTTNEGLTGADESNRTLFLTLAGRFGYFVIDQLEVTLSLGLLSKLASREAAGRIAENNFFFETGAHYHIPVGEGGFAFIPGAGLGGYFGGSTRTLLSGDGKVLDESTSTAGFLINAYLGVAYMPSPEWRLSSGLTLGALFGSETIDSQDASLAATAAHLGLPFEVSYVF